MMRILPKKRERIIFFIVLFEVGYFIRCFLIITNRFTTIDNQIQFIHDNDVIRVTKQNKARGFTLIELLLVIGILALLFGITLIAINPARQFSQANNTKRSSDVNAILNAINQYMADNKGQLPGSGIITTALQTIQSTAFNTFCSNLVPQYVAALPVDPL